jgi:hypothetical protein
VDGIDKRHEFAPYGRLTGEIQLKTRRTRQGPA